MFKKIDESMNMLRRDTGNIKRPTLRFYRWKCNMTKEKKVYWTGFNSRSDIAEEISELEDSNKYYQNGGKWAKKTTKKNKNSTSISELWDCFK